MRKKSSTLMGRRIAGIIAFSVLAAALVISLVVVLDLINAVKVTDPADGGIYYIREKNDIYSLYYEDKKTVVTTEDAYGYYVTDAGTLVNVDADTGEYEIIAAVETEGNENIDYAGRVLIFPHLEQKDILKLEVHNSEGDFTFVRKNLTTGEEDKAAGFVIDSSPLTEFSQELFASLHVDAGYTLTTQKVKNPIKDADGEYSEYGLVPEIRKREVTDENGEFVLDENLDYTYEQYGYEPAYYVITDINGNSYKIIIGDMLVTGEGYYVQYVDMKTGVKRDAVYVLSADIGSTLLAPIEDFVTPKLTYPMTINTYLMAENFTVLSKNPDYNSADSESDKYITPVEFTYVDMTERENTINESSPYVFAKDFELDGYEVSTDNITSSLYALYSPSFVRVVALSPTDKELEDCGLVKYVGTDADGNPQYESYSDYIISFDYDASSDGKSEGRYNNQIHVSEVDGKFYATTFISPIDENGRVQESQGYSFDMIVEIEAQTFEFLGWDRFDWINDNYVTLNLAYVDKIEIVDNTNGYSASFSLNNSETDTSEGISSSLLKVLASDSNGNERETFTQLIKVDTSGNIWVISASDVRCYSSSGSELTITSAYYDYNALGKQVKANRGQIHCADGSIVTVNVNEILINSTPVCRYDTDLFRLFYQTLLYSSIANSYDMSDAEEAALLADGDKLMLTMKISDTEGGVKEYKFYRLTSRKAYITVNGNGGFYVLSGRVEKFVSDAQKFFALEKIDQTGKY